MLTTVAHLKPGKLGLFLGPVPLVELLLCVYMKMYMKYDYGSYTTPPCHGHSISDSPRAPMSARAYGGVGDLLLPSTVCSRCQPRLCLVLLTEIGMKSWQVWARCCQLTPVG